MCGYGSSGLTSPMSTSGRSAYEGPPPNPGANMPDNGGPNCSSGPAINGRLIPNAQGAVGMLGVPLSAGTAQDSLLNAAKDNVRLDSGTRMILRVI